MTKEKYMAGDDINLGLWAVCGLLLTLEKCGGDSQVAACRFGIADRQLGN